MTKLILRMLIGLMVPAGLLKAQEGGEAPLLSARFVLHDPVNPTAELYVPDASGKMNRIEFSYESFSPRMNLKVVDGTLLAFKKASASLERPTEDLAATVKVAPTVKSAIVMVVQDSTKEGGGYRLLVLDDSLRAFPKGESRVISFVGMETAIEAGEHKLPLGAGKVTPVPPVKKLNEYNMAQTNLYYKEKSGQSWIPFTERQLQYLDGIRRLIIVHGTPGALIPSVTIIVDNLP